MWVEFVMGGDQEKHNKQGPNCYVDLSPCSFFLSFFFFFFNQFIYLWLHWFFVAARGLSLVAAAGATLRWGVQASHCSGFLLWSTGSRHVGFSSCGTWDQ